MCASARNDKEDRAVKRKHSPVRWVPGQMTEEPRKKSKHSKEKDERGKDKSR